MASRAGSSDSGSSDSSKMVRGMIRMIAKRVLTASAAVTRLQKMGRVKPTSLRYHMVAGIVDPRYIDTDSVSPLVNSSVICAVGQESLCRSVIALVAGTSGL